MDALRGTRGSSLVETALVMGVLMLLLLGIFDLGRAIYAYSDINQVAREAARYAVAHPGDVAGTRAAALAWTALDLQPTDVDVVFTTGLPATARVTVTYNYRAVSLLIAQLAGGDAGINLVGRSTMLME